MGVKWFKSECWLNAEQSNRGKQRAACSLYLSQIINLEWDHIPINIRQQDHLEKGSLYCVVKCIVHGNQAPVKNADFCHPSCTVVMHRRKFASPVLNVLTNLYLHSSYTHFIAFYYSFLALLSHSPHPKNYYTPFLQNISCHQIHIYKMQYPMQQFQRYTLGVCVCVCFTTPFSI